MLRISRMAFSLGKNAHLGYTDFKDSKYVGLNQLKMVKKLFFWFKDIDRKVFKSGLECTPCIQGC